MLPIVCIVGASNSGKTTFLERLIPALTAKGYRVGTVKHDVHGFDIDHRGKDTWRHRNAGSSTVVISSPTRLAVTMEMDSEMPLHMIAGRFFGKEDILITEGYKRSHFPKIEIFRSSIEAQPICGPDDNLFAIVTDDDIQSECPRFGFHQVDEVADLIENKFLRSRKRTRISIHMDGKQIALNSFVQDFLIGGILGMLSSLRGWIRPRDLQIQIRLEEN